MNDLGIYIHIPFCQKKCSYCDFLSFGTGGVCEVTFAKYVEKLIMEIEEFDFSNYVVKTIYIGGGTPSILPAEMIEKVLNKVFEKAGICDEISIEVNPGTVDFEKLETYKRIGINRISFGLQSVDNNLLKKLGRIHTYEQFKENYCNAKKLGFNVNIDLMIGLPNQSLEDIEKQNEEIKKLNPNHVSVYSLIIEENTKFYDLFVDGKLELPTEEVERQMYWQTKKFLEDLGYEHYEISNFAKKDYVSQHNLDCWSQKNYIRFGLGACSYIDNIRFQNEVDLQKYLSNEKVEQTILEKQDTMTMMKEYMMLGFRKLRGISINSFKKKFMFSPLYIFSKELEKLEDQELIEVNRNNICLTQKGLDLANLVFEEFV